MSQQPKQPDVFDRLEEDVVSDPPTGTYIAPDQPMGAQSHGTTSREQREGESFEERERHTLSESDDEGNGQGDDFGVLVQDGGQDVDQADVDSEVFAWTQSDEGDRSAEESAMHMVEDSE